MRILFTIIFVCCTIFVLSCTEKTHNAKNEQNMAELQAIPSNTKTKKQVILERVDNSFLTKLKSRTADTNTLTVVSPGGHPKYGIKIAEEIIKAKLNIVITELCLSACAEYVLPAAHTLHMKNEPLIGYHTNPMIRAHMRNTLAEKNLEFCDNNYESELEKVLLQTGKNTKAWKETYKRLQLFAHRVVYKANECPRILEKFRNRFWFPNSTQLREVFGLEFTGDICSDNPACFLKKIPHYFEYGGKFVVGDIYLEFPNPDAKNSKFITASVIVDSITDDERDIARLKSTQDGWVLQIKPAGMLWFDVDEFSHGFPGNFTVNKNDNSIDICDQLPESICKKHYNDIKQYNLVYILQISKPNITKRIYIWNGKGFEQVLVAD